MHAPDRLGEFHQSLHEPAVIHPIGTRDLITSIELHAEPCASGIAMDPGFLPMHLIQTTHKTSLELAGVIRPTRSSHDR